MARIRTKSNESTVKNTPVGDENNGGNQLTDLVERIIHAAESRDPSSREITTSSSSTEYHFKETIEGGPFTDVELSRLSLVRPESWNTMENDETVVSLTGMLKRHVASGLGIDLVGEARSLVRTKDGGDIPVITVQQVSNSRFFFFVVV